MPKGRNYAPDVSKDGNWYPHLGLPRCYSEPPRRVSSTSTGIMLNTPFNKKATTAPFPPPTKFLLRDSSNFKLANNFSEHNNRYLLERMGEHFGDGQETRLLGRRLAAENLRHHTTPGNFLHDDNDSYPSHGRHSIYTGCYSLPPALRPIEHRRFPREYREPRPEIEPDTTTTHWHRPPHVPYSTPLQVLATSQEPFLRHNSWKYSYNGPTRYYPPYTPITGRQLGLA